MKAKSFKAVLINTGLAATILLLASGPALAADSTVTLTAGPTSTTLPDGKNVPMWGYSCGTGPDAAGGGASCTTMTGAAQSGGWQPPLITVPSGQPLKIKLVNNLTFAGGPLPTSLVIVGQLGGGLGTSRTTTPSPAHAPMGTTWPGTPGGTGPDDPTFTPPAQADRVQSLATEVAVGAPQVLEWNNLRPGTYLIHTGTHPSIQHPMGLYGVLVVTNALYPGVAFDKDVALLFSEIDPVQNAAVDQAVRTAGFSATRPWNGQTGECGDPAVHTCYPPAVNFDPRYYLINGVAFDRTNLAASTIAGPAPAAPATAGNVLLRLVNAGLRMHVPSVVNTNMTLYAEDGNVLPGVPRIQNSVFLAAGKTYDVTIKPGTTPGATPSDPATYTPATFAVYDRQLSLSTNNQRDGGMQAYITIAGGAASGVGTAAGSGTTLVAADKTYYCVAGKTLEVTDPSKGVLAGATGANGATLGTVTLAGGATPLLTFEANGTFTYAQLPSDTTCGGTFTFIVNNGAATKTATITQCDASTAGQSACSTVVGGAPTANADTYNSKVASRLQITPPGVLANDTDPSKLLLTAALVGAPVNGTVTLNPDGSFVAVPSCAAPCALTFQYNAVNSQKTPSATAATVTVNFSSGSGLTVTLKDGKSGQVLSTNNDYRWIIEEDRTVWINPAIESTPGTPVKNAAINFHSSHTPVVAQGCVGDISCESGQTLLGQPAVCDVGNGTCRTTELDGVTPLTTATAKKAAVNPNAVALDPTKRYYISILPGNAWITDDAAGGYTMGGAQIAPGQTSVDVFLQKTPLQPANIAVFVFQDDYPLNGESDTGGGVDVLAPNEPGLGGFNIVLLDQAGGLGDSSGQLTYDMFGNPVTNALAGRINPVTGNNACAISQKSDGSVSLVGMIVTCPKYEVTPNGQVTNILSPLAGHALIANMYPGLYEVFATAGADRIARGEEWLQTNTLDGTKAIEAFIKAGEPGYFQEFGPGGYHVAVGFANPDIIRARKGESGDGRGKICSAPGSCTGNFYGQVTATRMSRTPDQRVYSSGSYDAYSFTQCYASLGEPDGADFAFAKCDGEGKFEFTNIPTGPLRVTIFDQYNDLLVDGLSTSVRAATGTTPGSGPDNRMEIPVTQWRTNLYGRIFLDQNGDGVSQESEPGLPLVPFNIRYRDGSYAGFNNTDLAGFAGFNEFFPFLNWMVVDTDSARYKLDKVHVVYDAGGPVDGTTGGGSSTIAAGFANTQESATARLPVDLRVPGSRYCASADCPAGDSAGGSTGRVDPGWATTQGWQGLLGQNSFIEFAMKAFRENENGGIRGHVLYTPTRPFDDPQLLLQLSWAPAIPNVKLNLYQQGTAADGSRTLTLVDTTTTTSWDDWAQGFRRNPDGTIVMSGGKAVPNMNCPGQETSSPFYFTMVDGTFPLDASNTPLAERGRFKCYDGWSMLNQVQPAPYNGMYKFPSVVAKAGPTSTLPADDNWFLQLDPRTYKTNCTICGTNPDDGTPMLPPGKYVVEVIVPAGYELVKEEDRNILMGDAFTTPDPAQFAGYGNIFIVPDQAAVGKLYNRTNTLQRTANNGAQPRREGDTGSAEIFWPCVGATRIVPDLASLFPAAGQQSAFAGASRPLCDRKEITLEDQMTALAKFYLYSSTHIAGHFTGAVTNDFASEFDPFSPQFGEKFAVPNVPVAIKDFAGKEISRVYTDQWGIYNGMNFSTWSVWPPSPSGYIPQMMIACMNDPGAGATPDPFYNPAYSNFCYEIPFMPGQTAYLDTPVVPTMAHAAGYNLPDCDYPDTTPAIKTVLGSAIAGGGSGPWVSAAGQSLTINALGDKQVLNHAYSGPMATTAPYNKKFITRHYGFGGTAGTVTIGGVNAPVTSWGDGQIVVTVPTLSAAQSSCPLAQRTSPPSLGTSARCGELEITAANGKKSIDTVTVTIGGKAPTYVTPNSPSVSTFGHIVPNPLQTAIDQADPGDLIIVAPGTYQETLLMWKPVRLQGVGAESVFINADAHPAGKMDAWRRQVNCLFGLALNGRPLFGDGTFLGETYDPSDTYTCPNDMKMRVDRIPFESIVGWDVSGNGNLAQMLQEPTLMGAYEGAGVTVLGRGVRIPNGSNDFWGASAAGGFPAGYQYLTNSNQDCNRNNGNNPRDYGTSNFNCNPSRIDGLSVINSSQGGGAIFVHGWNHNLEVANTRVHGNHGTFTGGITIGNGEFPDPFLCDATVVDGTTPLPFTNSCSNNPLAAQPNGYQYGYGFNVGTKVHHNMVTSNASIGDALYSGTPSAAGGVSFCVGADGYMFNNNWVCGNLSTGDAGGVAHSGFINNGTMKNNMILFNQSANPTIPTNGGGLGVLGAAPDRTINGVECGNTAADTDCPPGLAEGTGRNLMIDSNLILGNSAESGSGGGVRLQIVNGQDVTGLPRRSDLWNGVTLQNNIIANNVAGWDGGGVSMQDALTVRFVNNTVMSNDTTASAGVLFNTLGAPLAAVPPPGCTVDPVTNEMTCPATPVPTSTNQPAGLVTMPNSPNLVASIAALPPVAGVRVLCPANFGYGAGLALVNGTCTKVSLPQLDNNILSKNRAFHVEVGSLGTGQQNQQAVVTLVPSLNQTATGFCATAGTAIPGVNGSGGPVNYWDIGVRGDTGPTNHDSTYTLTPRYSIVGTGGYAGTNGNLGSDPAVVSLYCNGARIPPEGCTGVAAIDQPRCKGYVSPPGQSEFTGLPVVFALNQLTVAATVDEGNNWINLGYGPLSVSNASLYTLPNTVIPPLGNYAIGAGSPAINAVPSSAPTYAAAPSTDFFGRARKTNNAVDIGAVEFAAPATSSASVSPSPLSFGNWATGTTSPTQNLTVTNTGNTALAGGTFTLGGGTPQPFSRVTTGTFPGGAPNCGATLAVGASCTIKVQFAPTTLATFSRTLTVAYTGATVTPAAATLTGTGVAARATVSIAPNPRTITLPSGQITGTNTVTLTNTAPVGTGANMTVSSVSVANGAGGGVLTWFFNVDSTTCTGATLAPGASCTVTVRFTTLLALRGVNRPGTITFTDNAQPTPSQSGALIGFATP